MYYPTRSVKVDVYDDAWNFKQLWNPGLGGKSKSSESLTSCGYVLDLKNDGKRIVFQVPSTACDVTMIRRREPESTEGDTVPIVEHSMVLLKDATVVSLNGYGSENTGVSDVKIQGDLIRKDGDFLTLSIRNEPDIAEDESAEPTNETMSEAESGKETYRWKYKLDGKNEGDAPVVGVMTVTVPTNVANETEVENEMSVGCRTLGETNADASDETRSGVAERRLCEVKHDAYYAFGGDVKWKECEFDIGYWSASGAYELTFWVPFALNVEGLDIVKALRSIDKVYDSSVDVATRTARALYLNELKRETRKSWNVIHALRFDPKEGSEPGLETCSVFSSVELKPNAGFPFSDPVRYPNSSIRVLGGSLVKEKIKELMFPEIEYDRSTPRSVRYAETTSWAPQRTSKRSGALIAATRSGEEEKPAEKKLRSEGPMFLKGDQTLRYEYERTKVPCLKTHVAVLEGGICSEEELGVNRDVALAAVMLLDTTATRALETGPYKMLNRNASSAVAEEDELSSETRYLKLQEKSAWRIKEKTISSNKGFDEGLTATVKTVAKTLTIRRESAISTAAVGSTVLMMLLVRCAERVTVRLPENPTPQRTFYGLGHYPEFGGSGMTDPNGKTFDDAYPQLKKKKKELKRYLEDDFTDETLAKLVLCAITFSNHDGTDREATIVLDISGKP